MLEMDSKHEVTVVVRSYEQYLSIYLSICIYIYYLEEIDCRFEI